MSKTVLHVLSQRPSRTGSGVTLQALIHQAALAGWSQHAVVGVPADDPRPSVGSLPGENVHPLVFGSGPLGFNVPGMSDVMPYPSTRFSDMTPGMIAGYRQAWRGLLERVIAKVSPDVIHANHVWILSSLIKDVAPSVPVVTHCHSTGLRQMALCPHLAEDVRTGCGRNEMFVVQHRGLIGELTRALHVPEDRVRVVGAGYREELFHAQGREHAEPALAYVGKYAHAKGLPWLLDAFLRLKRDFPDLELHVAGSGAGEEAEALKERMQATPGVNLHGQLPQPELARVLRRASVFVMPSFYEGVPLVLVEALACGCWPVANRLPGIVDQLSGLGDALELVPLPGLVGPDQPEPGDLPAFVENLTAATRRALGKPPLGDPEKVFPGMLDEFRWGSVFSRVEGAWRSVLTRSVKSPPEMA